MIESLSAIVKALGYAAALSGAGTVLARATLLRGSLPPASLETLIRIAGGLLALLSCCAAILFVWRLGGEPDRATLGAVFISPLGASLALQLMGGVWLVAAGSRAVALPGALLVLLAFGMVGHSATRGLSTSISVVLHVTAAAWWLGGLWTLLLARQSPGKDFTDLVRRFGRQALWIVALLLAAALSTAVLLLEFNFDLESGYTRGLLAKAGLTSGLIALAGLNRLVLTPRLATENRHRSWLLRSILAEVCLFACIVCLTAWLTTWRSPHVTLRTEQRVPAGPIEVIDVWGPAMPGGVGNGAGYMVIINNQSAEDRLVAASSPWADHVSLHNSTISEQISRMREGMSLSVPAHGRVALTPGAHHLMFTGLYAPFFAGDVLPVVLEFERAGRVDVTLVVRPLGGQPGHVH